MSAAAHLPDPGRWLAIVGIGEDGAAGLGQAARALVQGAALVAGGGRHLRLAASLITGETLAWPSPMHDAFPAIVARRGQPVVVLASGDPYCYGVGATLASLVPVAETVCVPGASAFSLACARLGWAMQDVTTLSFCGRPLEAVLPQLQPGARLIALSADAGTPAALAALLRRHGFGRSRLHVLERLGGPHECIRACTATDGPAPGLDPLNTVAIEVEAEAGARVLPLAAGLRDELFEHDGQITKCEIRAVTLAALAPRAGETLWDIGCGSGSVSIEWVLRHRANQAFAVDVRAERAERAGRNARAMGAMGVEVITGEAPDVLAGLPAPDAVFIGGGAQDAGVLDAAWAALRRGGRLVVNAVALDTQALLFEAQARLGGTLTRLAVERLDMVGSMRAFRPAMPIVQFAAVKP